MNRALYSTMRRVFERYEAIRPAMRFINRKTLKLQGARPIRFSGWGMQTEHALPWDDESWEQFRVADNLAREIPFPPGSHGSLDRMLAELKWRHWLVCWAVEYAFRFTTESNAPLTMVECGVGLGLSSFFALHQAEAQTGPGGYQMHLYDSWKEMRASHLLPDEVWQVGAFSYNSVERTKRNLRDFDHALSYHQGFIPEIFEQANEHPHNIHYLSIDLDSAHATRDALEFLYPRMSNRGIIVLHDIGHPPFASVRRAAIEYLSSRSGLLFPQASGQAVFFVGES